MTVLTQTNKMAPQAMNGVATVFSFTFRALVDFPEAIKVVILNTTTDVETDLVYNTDYTVDINSDGLGGDITVSNPQSALYELTIYREYELTQESNFADYNAFPAETVENDYDKADMISQQIAETLSRAITIPITTTGVSTELPAPEADFILGWDPTATFITNIDPNVVGAASAAAAAASAAAALASQIAAASSASSASTSAATAVNNAGYAMEWAIEPEDDPVSIAAGGDNVTTFSALHWAAKAAAYAAGVNLPPIMAGDAGKTLEVNPGETGYQLVVPGTGTAADEFTIINDGGSIRVNDFVLDNIMLNALRIAENHSLTVDQLVDGVEDTFADTTGIDAVNSVDEVFEGGSVRTPVPSAGADDKLILNFNYIDGTLEIPDAAELHVITPNGNSQITPLHTYFGSGSLWLRSSLTQYLTTPDHADYAFGSTSDFSVDCWFKVFSLGATQYIYGKRTGAASKEVALLISSTGQIQFFTSDTTEIRVSTAEFISDNGWHHIYAERRTTGTILSVYLDGYQVGYISGTAKDITSTGTFQFGANGGASTFNGWIDEFRFSNNTRFSASPITNPIFHYTLNDNAASTTVVDYGSGLNNGTTVGGNTNTFHADGKVRYSFNFDGSTDYIVASGSATTIRTNTTGSFVGWVNFEQVATDNTILSLANGAAGNRFVLSISSTFAGTLRATIANTVPTTQWTAHTTNAISLNTWGHIALTHDGVTPRMYINGVLETLVFEVSTAITAWFNATGAATFDTINIGRITDGTSYFDGRIEDIRYYASNVMTLAQINSIRDAGIDGIYGIGTEITVPTVAHSSDANTILLLHFNGGAELDLTDSSTGGAGSPHAITSVAGVGVTGRFGNGYLTFDGTGDYLSIPDSDNWNIVQSAITSSTIGLWVRHVTHAGTEIYVEQYEDANNFWSFRHINATGMQFVVVSGGSPIVTLSGGEISDNLWHYVTLAKVLDEYGLYLDGVQTAYVQDVSTDIFSGGLYIAASGAISNYLNGDMDDIHINRANLFSASPDVGLTDTIAVPTIEAVSDGNTVLIISGNTQDESLSYHSPQFNGPTGIKENFDVFGRGSLELDGVNQALTIPDHADWDIFASAATTTTIDFWLRLADSGAGVHGLIGQFVDSSNFWFIRYQGGIRFTVVSGGGDIIAPVTGGNIVTTGWNHIAFVKINAEYGLYQNGLQVAYTNNAGTASYAAVLDIGRTNLSFLNGNMDELRLTNNNAFSAAPNNNGGTGDDTITVPVAAHTTNANTKLLLHFDSGAQLDLTDSSGTGKVITAVNGAHVTGAFGTSSVAGRMVFDGTNDDIQIIDHADWDVFSRLNENWTIDFWVRHPVPATTGYYMSHYQDASNYWTIYHTATNTIFELVVGGVTQVAMSPASTITNTFWHHIALIKIASESSSVFGLYIDGIQIGYDTQTSQQVGEFVAPLYIGQRGNSTGYLGGEMDGIHIAKSNIFVTTPTVGITDTFTAPITEPSLTSVTPGVMTLQTEGASVVGAAPDNIRVFIDLEDIDPTVVLNTDITVEVSRDNGTTFTAATMAQTGQATAGRRLIADTVDVSAQPNPGVDLSQVVVKIKTFNDIQMRLHAVSELWG